MAIVRSPVGDGRADGPPIFVELDAPPDAAGSAWGADDVLANPAAKVVAASRDMLADSVELARACAARFSAGLRSLPENVKAPDEVELELGITLDAELGAVLAKARGGAQLKMKLVWRNAE